MKKTAVLEKIRRDKLVPVVRTATIDEARAMIEATAECGISVFELTLTIPNAFELIKTLSQKHPDFLLGAGTVLNVEQAQKSVEAGAKFVVSPVLNLKIVEFCQKNEIVAAPAGLTPTEIYQASEVGADLVKVFPCDAMGGAGYVKALKTVFPHIELMPTGGVTLETVKDFVQAGATAVGVSSDLVDLKLLKDGRKDLIKEKIKRYFAALSE